MYLSIYKLCDIKSSTPVETSPDITLNGVGVKKKTVLVLFYFWNFDDFFLSNPLRFFQNNLARDFSFFRPNNFQWEF